MSYLIDLSGLTILEMVTDLILVTLTWWVSILFWRVYIQQRNMRNLVISATFALAGLLIGVEIILADYLGIVSELENHIIFDFIWIFVLAIIISSFSSHQPQTRVKDRNDRKAA